MKRERKREEEIRREKRECSSSCSRESFAAAADACHLFAHFMKLPTRLEEARSAQCCQAARLPTMPTSSSSAAAAAEAATITVTVTITRPAATPSARGS